MYQISDSTKLVLDSIERVMLTKDNVTSANTFIFLKSTNYWLQLYLDCDVLFIQKIDKCENIFEYISDLDQLAVFDKTLKCKEDITLKYQLENKKLNFKSFSLEQTFDIFEDNLKFIIYLS